MLSEVTLPAKPPMNSFVARWCSCLGMALLSIEREVGLSFFVRERKGKRRTHDFPSKKCSRTITAFTLAGSSNVKNAMHLKRPAASRMTVYAFTFPTCEKYSQSASTLRIFLGNYANIPKEIKHCIYHLLLSQFRPSTSIFLFWVCVLTVPVEED